MNSNRLPFSLSRTTLVVASPYTQRPSVRGEDTTASWANMGLAVQTPLVGLPESLKHSKSYRQGEKDIQSVLDLTLLYPYDGLPVVLNLSPSLSYACSTVIPKMCISKNQRASIGEIRSDVDMCMSGRRASV